MNKNKILSGGGKNLTGGGKWGWRGREVGGEGEGSGVKGGGKWGLGTPLSTPSKVLSGTIWSFWILQNHRPLRNKGTISLKILYCTIWSIWNYLKYEILKKQLAKQMTFWSIWKNKTLPTTHPFSVTYLMKSHVSYWKQKWNILSQQELISHILL